MGLMYSLTSFESIVALFGKDGITKEEILEINERTYGSHLPDFYHFDHAVEMSEGAIELRDGKYYPILDKLSLKNIKKGYNYIMKERARFEKRKKERESLIGDCSEE
jgi:hypothetical protein